MMNLVEQCRDRKIHTRKIEISTYEFDEENIVVEGILKDDLLIPIYVSEKGRQPHSPHHMIIQIRIECSSLTIQEVNVKMPTIPYDWCKETSGSLDPIKGLKIEPGFTSKVKKILRESKRCLHLTTLLLAIVPTVMQGVWTYNARKPSADDVPSGMIENYLVDTCWVWRKDGPRVKMLNSAKT
ncbi:DUF2889 domain-containing protein [Thermodesulfobacteriota bacterium]